MLIPRCIVEHEACKGKDVTYKHINFRTIVHGVSENILSLCSNVIQKHSLLFSTRESSPFLIR